MPGTGKKIRGLYAVIDLAYVRPENAAALAAKLITSGARTVQLRAKDVPAREALIAAKKIREVAARQKTLFMVNDRIDIALASGAGGIHIGQDDLPPREARKLLGEETIIGFSTHNEAEVRDADKLFTEGVINYISFGPIFPTVSKKDARPAVGIEGLRKARVLTKAPIAAIGGITEKNIRDVVAAGADACAVISAILTAPDAAEKAAFLATIINAAQKHRHE
ncbi:MAG: thiamine phosphate synthase [Deltaproteobacteria bacterium]|nr:thiamine phosphate synthase [Deltaproteobacteria bacterium]